jgi:hypothetical protein
MDKKIKKFEESFKEIENAIRRKLASCKEGECHFKEPVEVGDRKIDGIEWDGTRLCVHYDNRCFNLLANLQFHQIIDVLKQLVKESYGEIKEHCVFSFDATDVLLKNFNSLECYKLYKEGKCRMEFFKSSNDMAVYCKKHKANLVFVGDEFLTFYQRFLNVTDSMFAFAKKEVKGECPIDMRVTEPTIEGVNCRELYLESHAFGNSKDMFDFLWEVYFHKGERLPKETESITFDVYANYPYEATFLDETIEIVGMDVTDTYLCW